MGFRNCSDKNLLYPVKTVISGATETEGLLGIIIFWVFSMFYIISTLGCLPASWTDITIVFCHL